jgi:deazaflavin-dependent oxidoreductase (nitroreductase family)
MTEGTAPTPADRVSTGPFRGSRTMLLTTTPANGAPDTTRVVPYLPDGERMLLIAADGSGSSPDWYHDIGASPRVTVRTGGMTHPADAEILDGEEARRVFARAVEADPAWTDAGGAMSTVPVVALRERLEGPPDGPLGDLLVTVHNLFRGELAVIREEISTAGPSGRLAAQLRTNCLTFCHYLHGHHTAESQQIFPALQQRYPQLATVIDRLEREHATVKRLLDELQALLRGDEKFDDLLARFDRLAADLEAHLTYEEEQLVTALNGFATQP